MKFENKLLLFTLGFMIFYWAMQFFMLALFGVGYCAGEGFFSCVLPIVYGLPLLLTLMVFIPIYYYIISRDK